MVFFNEARDVYINLPAGWRVPDRPFTVSAITGDLWRRGQRFGRPFNIGTYWLTLSPNEITAGWKRVEL